MITTHKRKVCLPGNVLRENAEARRPLRKKAIPKGPRPLGEVKRPRAKGQGTEVVPRLVEKVRKPRCAAFILVSPTPPIIMENSVPLCTNPPDSSNIESPVKRQTVAQGIVLETPDKPEPPLFGESAAKKPRVLGLLRPPHGMNYSLPENVVCSPTNHASFRVFQFCWGARLVCDSSWDLFGVCRSPFTPRSASSWWLSQRCR